MQFSFRKQLQEKDITQYRSLIIFNVILIVYYIYDNIAYYILMKMYDIYMWPQIGYIIWYNILYFFLTIDVIMTATKQEISNVAEKMQGKDGEAGADNEHDVSGELDNHHIPHQPEKPKDEYEDYFSGDRLVISDAPNLNAVSPSLNFDATNNGENGGHNQPPPANMHVQVVVNESEMQDVKL